MEMLSQRVADTSFLRLVGKCLHVGVLDGEEYSEPQVGTVQGSVLSWRQRYAKRRYSSITFRSSATMTSVFGQAALASAASCWGVIGASSLW
jgi:hypothetical protein